MENIKENAVNSVEILDRFCKIENKIDRIDHGQGNFVKHFNSTIDIYNKNFNNIDAEFEEIYKKIDKISRENRTLKGCIFAGLLIGGVILLKNKMKKEDEKE